MCCSCCLCIIFHLIRIKTVGGSWKPSMEAKFLWIHSCFVCLSLPSLKSKNYIKLQWQSHMPFQRGCCKYKMLVNLSVVLGIWSSLMPVPRTFAFWVTEKDCFVVCSHFATGNCSSLSSSWILRILWSCVSPVSFKCFDGVLNSCGACYSFCWFYFSLFWSVGPLVSLVQFSDLSQVCNENCWLTSNLEAYNYLHLPRIAQNMDHCIYL